MWNETLSVIFKPLCRDKQFISSPSNPNLKSSQSCWQFILSKKIILRVTQQQQVEDEDIIFNTRRFSSTLLPAAAPPKRRYKSEEFLHIFTTVEFHQRTREQVMGPSFLGLDGKQMKTRTFFTNTNCDTSGNLVYNNWIFNSGEITQNSIRKIFFQERKKIQENLTVEKPSKGWSLQIISERNHNLS